MPELPEVETIKNELLPHIIGRRVTGITLLWEGIVRQQSVEDFRSGVIGQEIISLKRRGKYLIFGLSGGNALVIHLKMSGALLINPPPGNRFVRAIIQMDGMELYFRDPRKFGAMWVVKDPSEIINKLGPEPLEAGFIVDVLAERLRNRKAPIKALLTDQKVIAGIGNMYADEALFAAGIHPLRAGGSLSRKELERLHAAIRMVLQAAIGNKGASVREYFRPGGELGTAHYEFKVAHRRGEQCPVCGTDIQRIAVRKRGTYFCPKCQK